MSLWSWLTRKPPPAVVVDDPVFGRLTKDEMGCWEGTCGDRPGLSGAALVVRTRDEPPGERPRQTFLELASRLRGLQPQIGAALFELWRPWLAEIPDGHRRADLPRSAGDMLAATRLDAVWIEQDGTILISYSFCTPGVWDDVSFNVSLADDWVPRPEGVDD